ncbi:hypothetical protein FN846DRAFT_903758 [Sphaerosporella brunnea]|uniref:HNH nuclease domain-containing protein n=1 Tax=Sphaerosporella brunnea TaxID=1250544 RepID=A0A5J5F691_9PEZI|nr:hypothetical protein FN846DRAFT_903758 [Sphaerosporella brunnea]
MSDRSDTRRIRRIKRSFEEYNAGKDKRAMPPPPRPATPRPRSRVPSVSSTSYREPAATARSFLVLRDGGERCWLCGWTAAAAIDVAHNFFKAASDTPRFLQYQKAPFNLLGETTHPAHRSNLILLCKNHHALYDCHYPSWIMLPDDVDFFITWEEADFRKRELAAKRGVMLDRTVPSASDYISQLYRVHIIDMESMGVASSDSFSAAKRWGGNPLTVILKAMLGAFQISTAMPSEVKRKLLHLLDLYGRAPPPAKQVVHHDYTNDEDDELSSRLAPTLFSGTVTPRKRNRKCGPPTPEAALRTHTRLQSVSPASNTTWSPGTAREHEFNPPGLLPELWQFGPQFSANDVLRMICGTRAPHHGDDEDEGHDGPNGLRGKRLRPSEI